MVMSDVMGVLAVLVLVAANGFFVASEFSLVAVRRSRVAELVAGGRRNAKVLQKTVDNLDASLAATQLGITLSSLALGWIGEPALSHLIEPLLAGWAGSYAGVGSHAIAVAIAFSLITTLHIVLGELAPKSLALQRSETTALWIVRPLGLFLFLLKPAITVLNGLGNLVLRACGLKPGTGEGSLHSAEELKMLISASQEAGLLQRAQQEVVERVFNIGDRRIGDIMTPRTDIDWIDADDSREEILATIRACRHDQILVGRGGIDEPLGMVLKHDLLNQALDGETLNPLVVLREPMVVHEGISIFKVLERFRTSPVRMAMVLNEYGGLEGVVTQTDLLAAIAGHLPEAEGDVPEIVRRDDGSFLIDGSTSVLEVFEQLGLRRQASKDNYHTLAGFALYHFQHLPTVGEHFEHENWRFEIVDTDGRRIDKVLVSSLTPTDGEVSMDDAD